MEKENKTPSPYELLKAGYEANTPEPETVTDIDDEMTEQDGDAPELAEDELPLSYRLALGFKKLGFKGESGS